MQQCSKCDGQGFTLYLQEEMSSIYVSPTDYVAVKMREREHIPNAPISLYCENDIWQFTAADQNTCNSFFFCQRLL